MDHSNDSKLSCTHPLDLSVRGKIPVIPGVSNVFHTTRLCERLIQPKSDFDLTDPNGHLLNSEYSSLHDPNLRNYLYRKDIHRKLIAGGFITKDEKVICSLRELNRYRDHLAEVELDWGRRFRTEQKELVRKFLTLQHQGMIPHSVAISDVTEWLLQRGKNLFNMRQRATRSRFSSASVMESESSLLRLPSIAVRSNMVDLECCPSSTCRSELVWNPKGRQVLQEVIKEVRREMRLERKWASGQRAQEEQKQERHNRRMYLNGKELRKNDKRRTDPQDGKNDPSNAKNDTLDPCNTQADVTTFASPCSFEYIPSAPQSEPGRYVKTELSSLCQNLVAAVTKRSIVSAHNLHPCDEGLVNTASSTLGTCGTLIEHSGSLQSITQQVSEIEQRLLEEHFKGTITSEELHTIMSSVVVTVVEEVNNILIPAIMAFEYERLMASSGSSEIPTTTQSSLSSSEYYRSVSSSLQSSTPRILTLSATPTGPERTSSGTSCEKLEIQPPPPGTEKTSSPETCPAHLESSKTNVLVKVEGLIQDVIKAAVNQFKAEGDKGDKSKSNNVSQEQKGGMEFKSANAASRDINKKIRFKDLEVVDVTSELEVIEKKIIGDVMPKMEAQGVDSSVDLLSETKDKESISHVEEKRDIMGAEEMETSVDVLCGTKEEESVGHMGCRKDVWGIEYMVDGENMVAKIPSREEAPSPQMEEEEEEPTADLMSICNQEAKDERSFDTKPKLIEALEVKEEAKMEVKIEKLASVAERKCSRDLLIPTAVESSWIQIGEKICESDVQSRSKKKGNFEMSHSDEDDKGIPHMGPIISLVKSMKLSSDQVDEILEKVIDVLIEERHEVLFPEDRSASSSSLTSSPESRPNSGPLCCVSGGQEPHVQCPGVDFATPFKLLGGRSSSLLSLDTMVEDVSYEEILPYANRIIHVLMHKMQNDDNNLYEPMSGQQENTEKSGIPPTFFSACSTQSASDIPVLRVSKKADRRALLATNPNSIRVVMWVLQSIQRRHGWLGQANISGRQPKESRLLCEVIQIVLGKIKQKYAATLLTGDMKAPSLTDALKDKESYIKYPDSFKVKLQEATIGPISMILENMSANLFRPKSGLATNNKCSPSPIMKSISLTNMRSRALTSALATDISSSVVQKLSKASGCSTTNSSMADLRDFVRAMPNNHTEPFQDVVQEPRIYHAYKEVLEMVVNKLRSFVTQGLSQKPRQHLAQTMAESCLDVECAFIMILQTLKSNKAAVDVGGDQAVEHLATALSDTMFKHTCEARLPQETSKHVPNAKQNPTAPVTSFFDFRTSVTESVPQNDLVLPTKKCDSNDSPLLSTTSTTPSVETPTQQSNSESLKATPQKIAENIFLPKSCGRDIATVSGLGMPNLRVDIAPQTPTPEHGGAFIEPNQTSDASARVSLKAKLSKSTLNLLQMTVDKFARKLMAERVAISGISTQPGTKECPSHIIKRDQRMATPHSKPLVPTPPSGPPITRRQRLLSQHEDSLETRRGPPFRTLQAAKRVTSSMAFNVSKPSRKIAHPVMSTESLLREPVTCSKSPGAHSNTSLDANDIIQEVVRRLLVGDSPDLSYTSKICPL